MNASANKILLPHTDAGAGMQVVIVIFLTLVVATMVRRERSLVMLSIGSGMVVLGLMGMRALH